MTMMLYGSVTASLPSQQVRLSTTSKFGCISSHHRGKRCTQPQPMHTSATTLPSPVSPFPPAQLHRHPLRWRMQHGSTHCKISARMSTVPTMRPRAAPAKSSQFLRSSNRSKRRRSDIRDHTSDWGPPAQMVIRQPMSEISPPRRRPKRRPRSFAFPTAHACCV